MPKYDVSEFFDKWAKLQEAERNEHDQENINMDPESQQTDPNMATMDNSHAGNQGEEEQTGQTPKQSNQEIQKVTTPFSIFSGKKIQSMSLKKVGPNSAELKMDLAGYGPVTVSWVNNEITLTDAKTGRVINL